MTLRRYVYDYWRDLDHAGRAAIKDLINTLGANPAHIAAEFAVCVSDGYCQLHLTEILRNELGRPYLVDGQAATRPHVYDINPAQLPAAIRPEERIDQ